MNLHCLHHGGTSRADLDFSPLQPQHPLSKILRKHNQRRLYGEAQLHIQHTQFLLLHGKLKLHYTAASKMHQLLYRSQADGQCMWEQVQARTAFGRLISISAVPGLWP